MNEDTAKLISIPVAACLSTFLLWLLYLAAPPNVEGHWLILPDEGLGSNKHSFIRSLDFLSENQLIFDKDVGEQAEVSGSWYRKEQKIYIEEECHLVQMKYKLVNDTLHLKVEGWTKTVTFFNAIRQPSLCH